MSETLTKETPFSKDGRNFIKSEYRKDNGKTHIHIEEINPQVKETEKQIYAKLVTDSEKIAHIAKRLGLQ